MDIDGRLRALNVPRDAYRVVSLLPLVYVASADGKIQKVERDVILRIPRENGLLEHGGEDALDRWLSDPPTKEQLKTDLAILNELARNDRGGMNGFGADEEQLLLAWCQDVADAAGGMLGLGRHAPTPRLLRSRPSPERSTCAMPGSGGPPSKPDSGLLFRRPTLPAAACGVRVVALGDDSLSRCVSSVRSGSRPRRRVCLSGAGTGSRSGRLQPPSLNGQPQGKRFAPLAAVRHPSLPWH